MSKEMLARKLGEVLAFANVGLELVERAGRTIELAYGVDTAQTLRGTLEQQKSKTESIADAAKAERTLIKLRTMMEGYIGDEWDNAVEIQEWSGFYLGAAAVHWSLIATIADDTLSEYAAEQADYFMSLLQIINQRIGSQLAKDI